MKVPPVRYRALVDERAWDGRYSAVEVGVENTYDEALGAAYDAVKTWPRYARNPRAERVERPVPIKEEPAR